MTASGRRQYALTLVSGCILALLALRALPHPLPAPIAGEAACISPAMVDSAPMAAANLRCNGDGKALHGSLLLLAGHKIQVNSASVKELAELPGIGEKTAQRMVDHREAHGPFPSVEALSDVRGIGKKTVEKLRPFVAAE